VNEVKAVWFVEPFLFKVFDDEFYVWGDPVWLDGADVVSNYMGLGKFPVIVNVAIKNKGQHCASYSAISRAQMPVPVPRSRIFWGFVTGAKCSSPFIKRSQLIDCQYCIANKRAYA
jgi:hypothetical protein